MRVKVVAILLACTLVCGLSALAVAVVSDETVPATERVALVKAAASRTAAKAVAPLPDLSPTPPASLPPAPSPSAGEQPDVPPPVPSPPPQADTDPDLVTRLAALVSDSAVTAAGAVGVSVTDASGAVVFSTRASEPLIPASTQKLVVAAGALATLGPDYRYTTTVQATAPIGADGVLAGDLVMVGGGDPVLASPVFVAEVQPGRPHTPLVALADQLVAAGLRRVGGRLLGDPTAFADEPVPAGWLPRYLDELDGSRTSALTVDAGRRLTIEDGRLLGYAAEDPAGQAAAELAFLLTERGVGIDGGFGASRTAPVTGPPLAAVQSPPLRDLLQYMVQRSDNPMADTIFRSVGASAGAPTWVGSAASVRDVLTPLGLDWSGTVLADGSGLSRDDRLSATFLTALDAGMSRSSLAGEWEPLMAVAGRSGTLRRRLLGTVAEGRVRGKTGTLPDVRSIAGAVLGPGTTRYHVAVVGNGLAGAGTDTIRGLQDAVILVLAEDLYGCVRVEVPQPAPPAPPSPAPGQPPPPAPPAPDPVFELRCAA